jgi:hypothetical protein
VPRRPSESIIPGPADEGGPFVLVEDGATVEDADDAELAEGSDVHDVDDLDAQLRAEGIDAMLCEYLNDAPEEGSPPPAPNDRRRR